MAYRLCSEGVPGAAAAGDRDSFALPWTAMVEGIRDENGWTFSSDLSPERLAELQALVAANGLSSAVGPTGDAGEEAFARMVAAHPNATVIGGPAGSAETPDPSAPAAGVLGGGGWVFSSELSAESLAEV